MPEANVAIRRVLDLGQINRRRQRQIVNSGSCEIPAAGPRKRVGRNWRNSSRCLEPNQNLVFPTQRAVEQNPLRFFDIAMLKKRDLVGVVAPNESRVLIRQLHCELSREPAPVGGWVGRRPGHSAETRLRNGRRLLLERRGQGFQVVERCSVGVVLGKRGCVLRLVDGHRIGIVADR